METNGDKDGSNPSPGPLPEPTDDLDIEPKILPDQKSYDTPFYNLTLDDVLEFDEFPRMFKIGVNFHGNLPYVITNMTTHKGISMYRYRPYLQVVNENQVRLDINIPKSWKPFSVNSNARPIVYISTVLDSNINIPIYTYTMYSNLWLQNTRRVDLTGAMFSELNRGVKNSFILTMKSRAKENTHFIIVEVSDTDTPEVLMGAHSTSYAYPVPVYTDPNDYLNVKPHEVNGTDTVDQSRTWSVYMQNYSIPDKRYNDLSHFFNYHRPKGQYSKYIVAIIHDINKAITVNELHIYTSKIPVNTSASYVAVLTNGLVYARISLSPRTSKLIPTKT